MSRSRRFLLLCLALVLLPLQGIAAALMPWQSLGRTDHSSNLTAMAADQATQVAHACHTTTDTDDTSNTSAATASDQQTPSPHCGGCCLGVALVPVLCAPPPALMHLLYSLAESPAPVAGIDPDTPRKPPRNSLA